MSLREIILKILKIETNENLPALRNQIEQQNTLIRLMQEKVKNLQENEERLNRIIAEQKNLIETYSTKVSITNNPQKGTLIVRKDLTENANRLLENLDKTRFYSAKELKQISGLPRATLYITLNQLLEKGTIETTEGKTRRLYKVKETQIVGHTKTENIETDSENGN